MDCLLKTKSLPQWLWITVAPSNSMVKTSRVADKLERNQVILIYTTCAQMNKQTNRPNRVPRPRCHRHWRQGRWFFSRVPKANSNCWMHFYWLLPLGYLHFYWLCVQLRKRLSIGIFTSVSERRATNSGSSISADGENVRDAVTNVHSEEPTCEGIEPWNGDSEQEAQERAAKREVILRGRQLSDLNERELRNWMRTKSYTRSDDGCMGWGRKGKLTRCKPPRRQRVVRSDGYKMRCGWDDHDHINYTKFSCPSHRNYNGETRMRL